MPSVTIGVIEIDFTVAYPDVSIDLSFVVPDRIPFLGGHRYQLGGGSLSLGTTTINIPIDMAPVFGNIELRLDLADSRVYVNGWISLDLTLHSWRWNIGPDSFQYLTPFVLTEPSWSRNPVKLDPARLQAQINAAQDNQTGSTGGVPSLQNSAFIQELIRDVLLFAGAGSFVDNMLGSAQQLAQLRDRRLAAHRAHEVPAEAIPAAAEPGGVLIAIAAGIVVGAGFGLGGAYGLYFTSDGDFGYFGSVAFDAGVLVEIGLGPVVMVYWPDAGMTAKDCFLGLNGFVALDIDLGVSVGVAVNWPEDAPLHVTSTVPCGVAVSVGVGAGLPFNFFAGNSDTFLLQTPPPQLAPHGH